MKILFLGTPGSGKGTQASIIEKKFNIPQLSTGEMLRECVAGGSELGQTLQNIMTAGDLVSDDIIVAMIAERIEKEDCQNGFILDGFPRNIAQAKSLDTMLDEKNIALDKVIEIKVDDKAIVERITGRFSCAKCGEGYHDSFKKPQKENTCDACQASEFSRRKDDNEESVRHRLEVYYNQTAPLIEHYKNTGIFYSIDGMKNIDIVESEIATVLNNE